jgi:hypothetical protein
LWVEHALAKASKWVDCESPGRQHCTVDGSTKVGTGKIYASSESSDIATDEAFSSASHDCSTSSRADEIASSAQGETGSDSETTEANGCSADGQHSGSLCESSSVSITSVSESGAVSISTVSEPGTVSVSTVSSVAEAVAVVVVWLHILHSTLHGMDDSAACADIEATVRANVAADYLAEAAWSVVVGNDHACLSAGRESNSANGATGLTKLCEGLAHT